MDGPQNTSGYIGTPLEGKVQLQQGIQIWEVPRTGVYQIEARGASGGQGKNKSKVLTAGGRGARIMGNFHLERGTQLKILVGQQGVTVSTFKQTSGTGGGGSFVTTMNNEALVVAGGGGGGSTDVEGAQDGDAGQGGTNGSQSGGTGGSGGTLLSEGDARLYAGAGGGLLGNGQGSMVPPVEGGFGFVNGGKGGESTTVGGGQSDGGFGGGGGSVSDPGGGGGYSGGGVHKSKSFCKAGGGGSFNGGTQQLNEAGFNEGHGKVVITALEDWEADSINTTGF